MATNIFILTPSAPLILLNAVTTTGASIAVTVPKSVAGSPFCVTYQTVTTGSPTGVACTLKASLDGVNFDTIDTSAATAGEIRFVNASPAAYYQLSLDTFSGGTMPTFTGIIMVTNV